MRIAFDGQIFGVQKYGGISRYFYEVARHIADTEHTVFVVAPIFVNGYLGGDKGAMDVRGHHFPQIRRTGRIYRQLNGLITPPLLRRLSPDIVHDTYYARKSAAPAGCATVVTVHDMIHEKFPGSFERGDCTAQDKAAAVRRADHVICVSESTRRDLLEMLGVDPARTSVVHHGLSLEQDVSLREAPPGQAPRRPFVLYVGNRGGYKNFDLLLRAFAENGSMRSAYDIVAFGGGPLTVAELQHSRACGLASEQLRQMAGDDELLRRLYREAALLVYPSMYEGFGFPPLEAMGYDCPVVCSNASSLPEVVGDAAEMFNPACAQALSSAMERVAGNAARREQLIRLGRERVRQFTWQRCAQETLQAYGRVS